MTPNHSSPRLRWRIGFGLIVAVAGAVVAYRTHPPGRGSDVTILFAVTRAWWETGVDPYSLVRTGEIVPGTNIISGWGLIYPFPAALVALPFALSPWPDALFVGGGLTLLAWALRERPWAWWGFACMAGWYVVTMSQWEAWLTAAALVPGAGFLLAAKPHVGAALFVAYPSRAAFYSGLAILLMSVLLLPTWPGSWWLAVQTSPFHFKAPIQQWGGPLVLLALLEWRRAEARLLVALACIPQTLQMYSLFPLFLIPKTHGQGALLAAGVWMFLFQYGPRDPTGAFEFHKAPEIAGPLITWCVYLPATYVVMQSSPWVMRLRNLSTRRRPPAGDTRTS